MLSSKGNNTLSNIAGPQILYCALPGQSAHPVYCASAAEMNGRSHRHSTLAEKICRWWRFAQPELSGVNSKRLSCVFCPVLVFKLPKMQRFFPLHRDMLPLLALT